MRALTLPAGLGPGMAETTGDNQAHTPGEGRAREVTSGEVLDEDDDGNPAQLGDLQPRALTRRRTRPTCGRNPSAMEQCNKEPTRS